MIKILNLKLVTLLEYEIIKIFVQKAMFQIDVIKKVKNTKFTKKICQKQIKKSLELKKQFKKGNKLCVRWKGYNNSFNSCIDKKDIK